MVRAAARRATTIGARHPPREPQRIWSRTTFFLGDTLMLTPLLEELRGVRA